MKVWADHKVVTSDKVTCPLCREEFPLDFMKDLKKQQLEVKRKRTTVNVHPDTQCSLCRTTPISGERFHCVICQMLDFCGKCYRMGSHQHHPFIMRKKPTEEWLPVDPVISQFNERLTRELSPSDLESLRSLNSTQSLHEYLASVLIVTDDGICVFCNLDMQHIPRRHMRCGHSCHEVSATQACLVEVMRDDNCNSCPIDGAQILPGLDSRKHYTVTSTPCLLPPKPEADFSISGVQMNIAHGAPKRQVVLRIRTVNTRSAVNERRPPQKPTQRRSVPASRYNSAGSELSVVGRGAVSSAKSETVRMQTYLLERGQ